MKGEQKGEIILYQSEDGCVKIDVRIENESAWLTQAKIAELFGVEHNVISKHLRNIFNEGELVENSVCTKFAHTAIDGKDYKDAAFVPVIAGLTRNTRMKGETLHE